MPAGYHKFFLDIVPVCIGIHHITACPINFFALVATDIECGSLLVNMLRVAVLPSMAESQLLVNIGWSGCDYHYAKYDSPLGHNSIRVTINGARSLCNTGLPVSASENCCSSGSHYHHHVTGAGKLGSYFSCRVS